MSSRSLSGLPDRWLETALFAAAEQTELGVAVTLVAAGDAKHLFVNESGAALLGCTREEFLAREPFQDFNIETRPRLVSMLADVEDGKNPDPFDASIMRPDGTTIPLEVSLANVELAGQRLAVTFFRDVRARDAAAAALSSSEARFRALVEGAPDGVVISRDGEILYLNPAAVRLAGFDSADDLIGRPMSVFLAPEEIPRMRERIRMLQQGAKLAPAEYAAVRRDGTRIVAEITSLPIEFEGGPAVVAFARDVTERVAMQEQLARADRLASLGTLAAGVAHEVNNPLTFMALGLELGARRIRSSNLPDEEKEQILATLSEVRGGADRVALVVRDLKTFSRVSESDLQVTDVAAVVDDAVRIVAHHSKHFAEVTVQVGTLPRVTADPARLEQVFVNLLLNAVQAFGEARPTNRIEVRGGVESDDGFVFVDVVDNGPGIAHDALTRIFDPFFTTKPVGEGTGLGLAIVHGLLAQAGGKIAVLPTDAPGAHFRVSLPIANARTAQPQVASPVPEIAARRARVLVIDDEPDVAAVIERSLQPKHDVVAVTQATEGLALLVSDPSFDVVLCDLAMPGMSGTDVYRAATREHPQLARRFVIITGGAISGRMQGFLDSWSGPRLEKPFTRSELEAAVVSVVGASRTAHSDP